MKTILSFLAILLLSISAYADRITLQPGETAIVTYDYTGVWFGVQSWTADISKVGKNGHLMALATGDKITAEGEDLTASLDAYHVLGDPYVLAFDEYSLCGHEVQVVLAYSASAKKPIEIDIEIAVNLGGPCQ